MSHHLVVRVVSKLMIPFILLFGLYVQFHGDFGPGGGFQAGVIFAAAFVLYALVYGLDNAKRIIPERYIRAGVAFGVLIFGGTGVASLLLGGNYLDSSVLAAEAPKGQPPGTLIDQFGVGLPVASVMIVIFFAFAGRDHQMDEIEE